MNPIPTRAFSISRSTALVTKKNAAPPIVSARLSWHPPLRPGSNRQTSIPGHSNARNMTEDGTNHILAWTLGNAVDGRNSTVPWMVQNPIKKWDKTPPIKWCRISSIHPMVALPNLCLHRPTSEAEKLFRM